jgi:hypothetical protein
MIRGIDIHWDGDVYVQCPNHLNCNLGNIKNYPISYFLNIINRKVKYRIANASCIYEFCKSNEILNLKWDDPYYFEEI